MNKPSTATEQGNAPVGIAIKPMLHARLLSVELSHSNKAACYPFFVTGLLTLAGGKVESFAWHVPTLNWMWFDWSETRLHAGVAEKMFEMHTAQELASL